MSGKMIDTTKEARIARRREYEALKRLPFYSKEQVARLMYLEKQCKADNLTAMREARR